MPVEPAAANATVQTRILTLLKQIREATTQEVAAALQVTYEASRLQMRQLEASGYVEPQVRPNPAGIGRPLQYYRLSTAGEHFFPKQYDNLTVRLIDAVGDTLGGDALKRVMTSIADSEVAEWERRLAGMSLEERLVMLRDFYVAGDPYMDVVGGGQSLMLVERNCPYLNVALRRPALCSLTVSVLSRLLGYHVTRVQRFQAGNGCCAFQVHLDRPLAQDELRFEFEGEQP